MTQPVLSLWINGKALASAGTRTADVFNPATGQVIRRTPLASKQDVNLAVAAARAAFPGWRDTTPLRRARILMRFRELMQQHRDELVHLTCEEHGKTREDAAGSLQRGIEVIEFAMGVPHLLKGEKAEDVGRGVDCHSLLQPVGVCAGITPFNFPVMVPLWMFPVSIACGNTFILKPSEKVPSASLRMAELFHEAGLPPGVVNLVNGRGSVTGVSLVSHPGIDMVGFTGGTHTGAAIMAAAGKHLKPCILELGGKSANIIHPSADLDRALDGALGGIYSNNGQQCLAGSRILVQRAIAEEFIARFVERARRIRIGDPMDPATEVGPLAFKEHMQRVLSYVDVAHADGAALLTGGRRAPGFERGYYIEPTAVLATGNHNRVCQEEIFGPFATFLVYDTLDEAIAIANDSPFGLVAYVWANDLDVVMRASRGLRAGTVWINTTMVRELRAPFGGYKQSGVGRDGASSSVEFFTEQKTTTIPIDPAPLPRFGSMA